jgi:hypothetical protein
MAQEPSTLAQASMRTSQARSLGQSGGQSLESEVAIQLGKCPSGCTALEPATLQRCSTQGMASAGYSMLQVRWGLGRVATPFAPSFHLVGSEILQVASAGVTV